MGKQIFAYNDVSGQLAMYRDTKMMKNKLVTRYQLSAPDDQLRRPLEKSIVVSEKGFVKKKNGKASVVLRPLMSQHTVWLEGKKHFTQLKTLIKEKSLEITMESPEAKWTGVKKIKFPGGLNFCYFAQLAECIAHSGILDRITTNGSSRVPITIIWDAYPYLLDQLTNMGNSVFSQAQVYLDEDEKKLYRVGVDFNGQSIFYHFSKDGELVKMSWVGQGITIMSPAEAASLGSE